MDSENLFDPNVLSSLDIKTSDPTLIVRPLKRSDFDNGFIHVLSQLTVVGDMDLIAYQSRFDQMKQTGLYYILVVEDTSTNQLVASTTLFLEYKFIHSCALRGRIEDVVVDQGHRGKQLGKVLIALGISLSKVLGCYKLSLDCRDNMIPFYEKMGFMAEKGRANMMQIRFTNDKVRP